MTPKNFNFQKSFYRKNYSYFNDQKNAPNFFGCLKVKYLWPILCLYFWGPVTSGGVKKHKIKVISSIFMNFWNRNNLDQLDRLTPRHDLRCAIASCELRCAVASCDVRVRTHFGCKLRCACVRCFLRCAKCDRNLARFLVYITLLWVENRWFYYFI